MSEDIGFAVIDSERSERTGYPEVVYCAGKSVEQAQAIIVKMRERGIPVLATRADSPLARLIQSRFPEAAYDEISRVLTIGAVQEPRTGLVSVVCAGTSDLYAAREALLTAQFFGSNATLISDVGVAGVHRLFARLDEIKKARVVVVAAGMEGALPSVVAGLVSVPVIALPTSVGYGASFGGLSALLGMLNSCSPGVAVVNIDNGFGAGYLANQINRAR
ncbi:MAG: nickel pincer cofactor biosynthesis protein LarB [Spirochaetaceae bacterium]|jgi:NCAIR mutase (PurE)-related protein|nr:nickel pincer cofactor biosynthesis protein LarB [Spirochaetaceae bacterium]